MKSFGAPLLVLLGLADFCAAVTPIAKVLELMKQMEAKGVAEKEAEAVRFSAFGQWCGDQKRIKTEEIATATEKIEMLTAKIEKAAAEIAALTDRIQELDEDVGRWEKDTKAATEVREKEAADYMATSLDFGESLDALDGAILVLKKKSGNIAQAQEALLQVKALPLVPEASKRALVAFLQQGQPAVEEMPDSQLFNEAPEAYGYEFQSGGVVDMLEKLKDQFSKQKYDMDAEELKAKHAFEQMAQQLADNIENAKHEISKKTAKRAETQEAKADMEGEKAQVEADRAEDEKYLSETNALCAQKTEDFNSRQKLRGEELEAIRKAIEIISSNDVSGAGEKHLPQLLQVRKGAASLAQLRSAAQTELLIQSKVATFLADQARRYGSRILLLASQHVAADPFIKVKKMIKDLISQLMQESTQEIEHKGWCDAELATNKNTREAKTQAVEELTASKEDLTSTIAQLSQDIEDLTKAIQELDVAMADATAERTASKEKNAQTVEDAKAAQVAVQQATAILKDFYAKSAEATALAQTVQTPADDAPETFSKPYQGLLPEGGSVVDFLEVILTDFARLQSETETSEAAEQDEFEKYMFDSKKDRALKENEKGHKEAKKQDKESELVSTEQELKLTQEQLDKAMAYYEKLKPTCVDSGITYEERVKRREEEIQSLQEALKILQGTDLS